MKDKNLRSRLEKIFQVDFSNVEEGRNLATTLKSGETLSVFIMMNLYNKWGKKSASLQVGTNTTPIYINDDGSLEFLNPHAEEKVSELCDLLELYLETLTKISRISFK